MSDPRRLLDGSNGADGAGGAPVAASLLRSAGEDRPSDAARARAALALGIAGGAAGSGSASGSAPSSTAASSGSALAPAAAPVNVAAAASANVIAASAIVSAKAGSGIALKLVLVVLLGGAGAVVVSQFARDDRTTVSAPVLAPETPVAVEAKVEETPVPELRVETSKPVEEIAPPVRPPRRARETTQPAHTEDVVKPEPATAPEPAHKPTLAEEVALIDRARASLASDDAAAALDAIREHRAHFAEGALIPEADALEVEAVLKTGDRERARTLRDAFVAKHPDSRLARRLDRLFAPAAPPK